jgi:flagellar biosynthesis protein FlhA
MEIAGSGSALLAVGVIGILMVMIAHAHLVLDLLLSVSIVLSIVILLMSLYVTKPLDFSVFPSVPVDGDAPAPLPERGLVEIDPSPRQ